MIEMKELTVAYVLQPLTDDELMPEWLDPANAALGRNGWFAYLQGPNVAASLGPFVSEELAKTSCENYVRYMIETKQVKNPNDE